MCRYHGCGKAEPRTAAAPAPKAHEHKTPHGGTAIELGEEAFHVELVKEDPGTLSAYVLDGELLGAREVRVVAGGQVGVLEV
jgi:hypothetical protein